MIDLELLGLKFIGFWDGCYFGNDSRYSGLIVEDKDGNEHSYSYFELHKMMKKAKGQSDENECQR